VRFTLVNAWAHVGGDAVSVIQLFVSWAVTSIHAMVVQTVVELVLASLRAGTSAFLVHHTIRTGQAWQEKVIEISINGETTALVTLKLTLTSIFIQCYRFLLEQHNSFINSGE
jgi:hypothetical protein